MLEIYSIHYEDSNQILNWFSLAFKDPPHVGPRYFFYHDHQKEVPVNISLEDCDKKLDKILYLKR